MINLVKDTILYVLNTLAQDAVPLAFGIIAASILNVYIDPEKFRVSLMKRKEVSIIGSVAFGTFTPLCSCGTMAVIISMLTTVLPWGPIIAFITSSPLMSPDLFVMLSGIISLKFAVALTVSSLFIGITAGYISHYLEKHTGFFKGQIRFTHKETGNAAAGSSCSCSSSKAVIQEEPARFEKSCCQATGKSDISKTACCASDLEASHSGEICCTQNDSKKLNFIIKRYKLKQLLDVIISLGIKKILLYFCIFAVIGYFINRFVPAKVIMSLFGSNNIFSVPLAALIGIPLYVSDAGSIPLIKALMNSGASGGAILAFMITGPGTSIGAIIGSLTIMKRKAVLFAVSILFISAILLGYLYNLLILMGL